MEKKSKLVGWRFTKKQNTAYGRAIYISGNVPELGSWEPTKAIRLECFESDNWSVEVNVPIDKAIEYKYVEGGFDDIRYAVSVNYRVGLKWEIGENRKLNLSEILHYRDGLSIMTFNVRYENEKDGDDHWENRRDQVFLVIDLGVQNDPQRISLYPWSAGSTATAAQLHARKAKGILQLRRCSSRSK